MSLQIVTDFLNAFYKMMMEDRMSILPIYRNSSLLTYNGGNHAGVESIKKHLEGLSFKKISYNFDDYDAQPLHGGGILIVVAGELCMDDSDRFKFNQTFVLMPEGETWFIQNDVLKIIV